MNLSELITSIDGEIDLLKQVRRLLDGIESRNGVGTATRRSRRGRGRRKLSAEARARISAAQKKRWAQQKRTAKR